MQKQIFLRGETKNSAHLHKLDQIVLLTLSKSIQKGSLTRTFFNTLGLTHGEEDKAGRLGKAEKMPCFFCGVLAAGFG